MRYLLDTNAVIEVLRNTGSPVGRRIRQYQLSQVCISSIVLHELFYGAFKSAGKRQNVALVDDLMFEILDFNALDARHSGEIRAALASTGTPIGPYDILIAGQARAREITLVTHNTKEFERVEGLRIEDWQR